MLMYVSKLMGSKRTFNYGYTVDGKVIEDVNDIPKDSKAIVVSYISKFSSIKESITQEQVIQTHAGRWIS